MIGYADVCWLITTDPAAHGVHEKPEPIERMVYCVVKSVGRTEYYAAHNAGLQPEMVLKLADMAEYQDELKVKFHEKIYTVLRTYMTDDGGIEITIQRGDINGN